jgi:hypothetical protein
MLISTPQTDKLSNVQTHIHPRKATQAKPKTTTMDMKGENTARLEAKLQAEAHAQVSPFQGNGLMATMEIEIITQYFLKHQKTINPHPISPIGIFI